MTIVINAFSARLGGGKTYLLNLLSHMPEYDDVEVLVYAPADLKLPEHPRLRRMRTRWPVTNPLTRTLWELYILPRLLRRENADVLFCPGGVVLTNVPRSCRVVTMFRNMLPFTPGALRGMTWGFQRVRNIILKRVLMRSLVRADLTIFISDYARGVIQGLTAIRNPVTIPHGINSIFRSFNKNLSRSLLIPAEDYLLYVSRFDVYKHHYEVVSAYGALPENLRERYALVLVGENHMPEADRVQALVAELGLQARVKMLGAVPYGDLPAIYHHAKIVLFASSCENCPNILLESFGAGRPVLCSNVMPMPEFAGRAVGYFSPMVPHEIRDQILHVLNDDRHEKDLAEAAALRSMRFDWVYTAKTTWEHILKLVEMKPVRS